MHYIDEGPLDDTEPLVLVHGNPTWSFHWRNLVRGLSADRRVLAPDHIGMGMSDKPPRSGYPFRLDRRVADFGRFLDATIGDRRFTLVVHDWGGPIGLGWAVDHPNRVARIVLTNTAAFPAPPGKPIPWALKVARSRPLGSLAVRQANAFARGALRWGVTADLPDAVRAGYLAPTGTVRGRLAIFEFVRDIPDGPGHRSHRELERIAAGLAGLAAHPVLICWGGQDFVFDDRILAEWLRRWPAAHAHRFPDAGHLVLEDAEADVIRTVREFVV